MFLSKEDLELAFTSRKKQPIKFIIRKGWGDPVWSLVFDVSDIKISIYDYLKLL